MVYDYFETGLIGTLTLVADQRGLRHIKFEESNNPIQIEDDWTHDPGQFIKLKGQLSAYFNGQLKTFDLSLAPIGTTFQKQVWAALQTIPYGTVASYGQVARQIGNPKACRAVGGANNKNPIPIIIPCHRVIGNDGSLTGFGGGLDTKRRLLDLEKQYL